MSRPCTSDFYLTHNLPERFEYPDSFKKYGIHRDPPMHPFFMTTASEYGFYPPTHHTVPVKYHVRPHQFTDSLRRAGMYRNFSLNL
ncbi:unnamed protein product [Bemisia tabaci]|uniref:Uncharacterized protein n=1 Tax=Bemisia tabaci TaxID=7038 RepID=A0A9P0A1H5_BEMTA|nr:unnamed protein product [Bemisia tabaci]